MLKLSIIDYLILDYLIWVRNILRILTKWMRI